MLLEYYFIIQKAYSSHLGCNTVEDPCVCVGWDEESLSDCNLDESKEGKEMKFVTNCTLL